MKPFTLYLLVCFHPLFTFPLPLPVMKKIYFAGCYKLLLHLVIASFLLEDLDMNN